MRSNVKTPYSQEKRKEALVEIRKIIKLLQKPPEDLEFHLQKRLKGCTGFYDYNQIVLGAYVDIIPTLIHEILHVIHDEWSESKVVKYERLIKRYITIKEMIVLVKLLGSVL